MDKVYTELMTTFPNSPRVIYDKNPLAKVICQLRFPPILRVDAELPAAFQEQIRQAYPLLEERQQNEPALNLAPDLLKMMGMELPFGQATKQGYDFASKDEIWKVSLTREFLALSALKYETWDDFKAHLQTPLDALLDEYKPSLYTRIGLRYRNVIKRSVLGLKDCQWSELLESHVANELATEIASGVKRVVHESAINLTIPANAWVKFRHGLAQDPAGEECYFIDSDFFTDEKTEVNDALERLDHFNKESGRLFRWCITDRLHQAMVPRALAA